MRLDGHFDKWLYVFKNLHKLHTRPERLQERVFEKLFSIAEIAKFSPIEAQDYEDSLMVYRDLKNSIDTARAEGETEKAFKIATIMIQNSENDEKILLYTGINIEQVRELRKRLR